MSVTYTGDRDFESTVLRQKGLTMVFFTGGVSLQRDALDMAVDMVAEEKKSRFKTVIYNFSTQKENVYGEQYFVRELPECMMFRDGKPVAHFGVDEILDAALESKPKDKRFPECVYESHDFYTGYKIMAQQACMAPKGHEMDIEATRRLDPKAQKYEDVMKDMRQNLLDIERERKAHSKKKMRGYKSAATSVLGIAFVFAASYGMRVAADQIFGGAKPAPEQNTAQRAKKTDKPRPEIWPARINGVPAGNLKTP